MHTWNLWHIATYTVSATQGCCTYLVSRIHSSQNDSGGTWAHASGSAASPGSPHPRAQLPPAPPGGQRASAGSQSGPKPNTQLCVSPPWPLAPLQVGVATPSLEGPPVLDPAGTYKAVAGAESAVGHHAKARGAVSRVAAVWAEAGLAHRGQGAGHLPAVQKGSRVLGFTHHSTIIQGEVIGCISIADTLKGAELYH